MIQNSTNLLTDLKLEIRLDRSKKLLDAWCAEYNKGRPLKNQIRAFQRDLTMHMIRLFWSNFESNKKTTMFNLKRGELPTLRTSNGALAKEFGVCRTTIKNARKRMEKAGLVVYKCWHGSSAPYELWINPLVLYFSDAKNRVKGHPFSANLNHLFFTSNRQTLPHRETGLYPVQDTNKEKNRKGEEIDENVDNFSQSTGNTISSTNNIQVTNETGYQPSKINPVGEAKQVTAPPVAAAPPALMPETVEEVLAHLSEKDAKSVKLIATICFSYAEELIFNQKYDWLSDEQKKAGIRGLAEYIAWGATPKQYNAVKGILMKRIYLAAKWFNYKPYRFARLPDYYFNMRNEKGSFVFTEQLLKDHQRTQYKDRRRKAMRAAVSKYSKALLPGSKVDKRTLYHELTQNLRKKYGTDTVQFFDKRINDIILNSK